MELLIIGGTSAEKMKKILSQSADNVSVTIYSSVDEFLSQTSTRPVHADRIFLMQEAYKALGANAKPVLDSMARFLGNQYPSVRLLCLGADTTALHDMAQIFISPNYATFSVARATGNLITDLALQPIESLTSRYTDFYIKPDIYGAGNSGIVGAVDVGSPEQVAQPQPQPVNNASAPQQEQSKKKSLFGRRKTTPNNAGNSPAAPLTPSQSSGFGGNTSNPTGSPFNNGGAGGSSNINPFASGGQQNTNPFANGGQKSNPFAKGANPNTNPFGNGGQQSATPANATQPNVNPFANGGQQPAPKSNPFAKRANQAQQPSANPFAGGNQPAQNANPFGNGGQQDVGVNYRQGGDHQNLGDPFGEGGIQPGAFNTRKPDNNNSFGYEDNSYTSNDFGGNPFMEDHNQGTAPVRENTLHESNPFVGGSPNRGAAASSTDAFSGMALDSDFNNDFQSPNNFGSSMPNSSFSSPNASPENSPQNPNFGGQNGSFDTPQTPQNFGSSQQNFGGQQTNFGSNPSLDDEFPEVEPSQNPSINSAFGYSSAPEQTPEIEEVSGGFNPLGAAAMGAAVGAGAALAGGAMAGSVGGAAPQVGLETRKLDMTRLQGNVRNQYDFKGASQINGGTVRRENNVEEVAGFTAAPMGGFIDDSEYQQQFAPAPRVVEKIVEKEVYIDSGTETPAQKLLDAGKQVIIVVTGDRRSGVTYTALSLANIYGNRVNTLLVDLDTETCGAQLYQDIDILLSEEENVRHGLQRAKNPTLLGNLVHHDNSAGYDYLFSMLDNPPVSDVDIRGLQNALIAQRQFQLVIIDCPWSRLSALDELFMSAKILICVDPDASGCYNIVRMLDRMPVGGRFTTAVERAGAFIAKQGTSVDNLISNMQWIGETFSSDGVNWAGLRVLGTADTQHLPDVMKKL